MVCLQRAKFTIKKFQFLPFSTVNMHIQRTPYLLIYLIRSHKINAFKEHGILPILNSLKRLLVCNVIHQNKSHRSAIVCSCYCPVSFLAGWKKKSVSHTFPKIRKQRNDKEIMFKLTCIPNLQLDSLVVSKNRLHFEIDSHCWHESWSERIISISEKKWCLSHSRISNDQKFEHVIEILVGRIFLPLFVVGVRHVSLWNTFPLQRVPGYR